MLFITIPSINRITLPAMFGCSFTLFKRLCALTIISVVLSLFALAAQATGPFEEVPWNENPPLRPPVDAGGENKPAFADIDKDGDLDVFIGAEDGMLHYYENTGSTGKAVFTERMDTANPLEGVDVGERSAPFLADLDKDGDLDAFIGAGDGTVHYYENTGNAYGAVFTEHTDMANPLGRAGEGLNNRVPFLADIDNDDDLDAFIGAEDGTVHYYENTESADGASFTERTNTANPLGWEDVGRNSAPFLADIDKDGDLDAFIGAEGYIVRYYENTGSMNEAIFVRRKNEANPLGKADMKRNSTPFLADIDSDGDLDVFIGAYDGMADYYENTGSAGETKFTKHTDTANPLGGVNVASHSAPFLADIDNDGDLDAFIGAASGTVRYYENTGSVNRAVFTQRTDTANPLSGVDEGVYSTPFLADIDNDGDLDAFIGAQDGTLRYYENTGSVTGAVFTKRTDIANPLSRVNIGIYSAPFLADLDRDGDLDAFIGTEDGTLHYYENTGSAAGAVFTKRTDMANPLDRENTGRRNAPFLADLDRDGDLDAFIGTEDGAVRYYENTGSADKAFFIQSTNTINPLGGVDMKKNSTPFLADIDNDGDLDAFIGAESGTLRYYENTGNTGETAFMKRTDTANPLGEADVGYYSVPFLADIDNDDDLDAFIGTLDGMVRYYENTGSASGAVFTKRTDTANPLDGVEVEVYSTPFLADMDGDDDLDAFIGARDGTVHYYENCENNENDENCENTESADGEAFFTERTDTANPLVGVDVGFYSIPFLTDIDKDGDLDAFIGAGDGMVRYYENTESAVKAAFFERTDTNNPLGKVNVRSRNIPFLADMDRDGDLDAFVGTSDGTVSYYENTGSATRAFFIERTGVANPLGDVDAGDSSAPFLADMDNDGDLDAFIGTGDDKVHYYVNTRPHILADSYAMPKGGNYSTEKMQISLNCLSCEQGEKIYYILDGLTDPAPVIEKYIIGQPIEISATSTLNFAVVDAMSNAGTIYTEKYIIDSIAPDISITFPAGNDTTAGITEIKGTVSDAGDSALDRIELQIFSDPLYFRKNENETTFSTNLTWLLVSRNTAELRRTGEWTYRIDDSLFPVGAYRITARAFDRAGNVAESTARTVYKATQARADLTLEFKPTLKSGDTLYLNGRLISRRYPSVDENLENRLIQLYAMPESCIGWEYTKEGVWQSPNCSHVSWDVPVTSDTGQYLLEILPEDTRNIQGKFLLQARFAGDNLLTETVPPAKPLLIGQSAGYAVLIQGRALIGDRYEGLEAHNKSVNRIYRTLLERGFERENIFYFNFNDPLQDVDGNSIADDIDGIPAKKTIAAVFADDPDSLEDLADRIKGSPAPFYLIMVDHGDNKGNFYIDQQGEAEKLTPAEINAWLVSLETALMLPEGTPPEGLAQPRLVIMGSCFSGAALSELSLPGRIVITSAAAGEESYKGPLEEDGIRGGEYFVDALFQALGRGDNFNEAFSAARERTRHYTRRDSANAAGGVRTIAVQNPQLNVDGEDMTATPAIAPRLADIELGAGAKLASNFAGMSADICGVTDNLFLQAGEHTANLRIRVNDAWRVKSAPVDVRRPDMKLPFTQADGIIGPARQLELTELYRIGGYMQCSRSDHICKTVVTNPDLFKTAGRYELYYFVTDSDTDDISPLRRSFVYKAKNCGDAELVCNLPPSGFDVYIPDPGLNVKIDTTVRFYWQTTSDPDGDDFTYTLEIAGDAGFANVVYRRDDIRMPYALVDGDAVLWDCGRGLRSGTTYHWRVTAIDRFGARALSRVSVFTTKDINDFPPDTGGGLTEVSAWLENGWLSIDSVRIEGAMQHYNALLREFPPGRFVLESAFETKDVKNGDTQAVYYPETKEVVLPKVHFGDEDIRRMVLRLVSGTESIEFVTD
ncbi:MAG: hypothetical protein GY862_25890 [Gammaproteobacteria bacterium]|nr:hypothetical protein [Gammaproteobacteria bacterium]